MDIHSFVAVFMISKIGGFLDNTMWTWPQNVMPRVQYKYLTLLVTVLKRKKKLVFGYSLSLVGNDYLSLSYALQ